jgi:hypothetical protein
VIRYSLRCHREHEFEAWFRSGGDYDKGVGAACPICGSEKVEKILMAPAVAGTKKKGTSRAPDKEAKVRLAAAPDPRMKEMREALKEIRRQVTENADYVGESFAEEARKIHYNETEPRAIYGEATSEEAKGLIEEGVEFQPLPSLPEDRN